MNNSINRLSAAAALSALAAFSGPAWADTTFEILTLGDSITFGSQSDTSGEANPSSRDSNLGGYRFYLDRNLDLNSNFIGTDFDFVGNRSHGTGISGFADNQHFGVSGSRASQDSFSGSGENVVFQPSMLTGISNAGETDSIDAAFDTRFANPNAVLLGIGINSLPRRGNDLGGDDNLPTRLSNRVSSAVGQFVSLLDGDDGSSRLDGNDGPRTGLVNRLNDNAYFSDDAHLFVAFIIPRVDGDGNFSEKGWDKSNFLISHQPSMVADYNNRVKTELESRMGPGGALEGKVTFVDMFSIAINELDTQALADEFYSGNLVQLLAAISPEDDAANGGLDYVDWAYNAGFSFDEGKYADGTLPDPEDLDLLDPAGGNNNFDLMRDKLHPTNLGYAIMAQVWENALEAHYVPEPSAMLLFLGGGLLAMGRRRRRPM